MNILKSTLKKTKNGTRKLNLFATLDAESAYTNADFIVIAAPTNYDSQKNFFDTSAVESVIKLAIQYNPRCYNDYQVYNSCRIYSICAWKYHCDNILFSLSF